MIEESRQALAKVLEGEINVWREKASDRVKCVLVTGMAEWALAHPEHEVRFYAGMSTIFIRVDGHDVDMITDDALCSREDVVPLIELLDWYATISAGTGIFIGDVEVKFRGNKQEVSRVDQLPKN